MRVAVDTNVLVYAEGMNGASRRRAALSLLRKLPRESVFIPVQVLGELYNVLVRKAGKTPAEAKSRVLAWQSAFGVVDTAVTVMTTAIELASGSGLNVWDAVILSAAAESGCRLLLSEDMQDGFTWNGVTVANPFASPRNPLIESIL